jgi:hypothetical protein
MYSRYNAAARTLLLGGDMYVIFGVDRECVWCIMHSLKDGSLIACVRRAVVSNELLYLRFHRATSR